MSAPDLNAAKMITTALNLEEGFSMTLAAMRGHRPQVQGKGLTADPIAIVCPGGRSKERVNKNHTMTRSTVFVGLFAKLNSGQGVRDSGVDTLTQIESLIHFSEELEAWFLPDSGQGRNFSGDDGNYTVDTVSTDPTYDPEEIERGRFMSVIRVELEELRG